ncbi:MAG: hypothetical protein MI919_24970, partial [Holophagales bacterium]|nr:hypothetical protein [Holophagales bacterium]
RARQGRWRVEAGSARLGVELADLLERRFTAPEARLVDTRLAWRSSAAAGEKGELPEIEGFPGEYRPAERKPSRTHPWRLQFDAIRFEPVELWLDRQRIVAGPSAGEGMLGLAIEVRGPVALPEVRLRMADAVLHSGNQDRGRMHLLELDARVDPFRPREHRGLAWLRLTHGRVQLRADGWGADAAAYYFRGAPVALDGFGRAEMDVAIAGGELAMGSFFRLEGESLTFDYLGYRGSGDGRLALEVAAADEGESAETRFALRLDEYAVASRGRAYLRGEGLELDARSPSTDLVEPEPAVSAELRLPPSEVPDLSVYDGLIPEGAPFTLRGGQGTVEGQLAFDTARSSADGSVKLVGRRVEAAFQDHSIRADLELSARLVDGDPFTRSFQLERASLHLDRVSSGEVKDWWARLEATRGGIQLADPALPEARRESRLEAQLSATLADPSPFLALLEESRPAAARWLGRLVGHGQVRVSGHLASSSQDVRLADLELAAGRHWRGWGQLHLTGGAYFGLALLTYGPLAASAEIPERGERRWKLLGAADFYREQEPEWRRKLGVGE